LIVHNLSGSGGGVFYFQSWRTQFLLEERMDILGAHDFELRAGTALFRSILLQQLPVFYLFCLVLIIYKSVNSLNAPENVGIIGGKRDRNRVIGPSK
jgi:hypothetical protein